MEYRVIIHEPASGYCDVTMVIRPPRRAFLTFWLRDTRLGGLYRVQGFSAKRGNSALIHWQTLPGFSDARSVWTGFSREPLEVNYEVNPRWTKNPRAFKSYLGPDFGYLRGMVTLYTPISLKEVPGMLNHLGQSGSSAGRATLQFSLPEGWILISPWGSGRQEMAVAEIRNVYFGVGPMSVATVRVGEADLIVGVYSGLDEDRQDSLLQNIPDLFETMLRTTGFPPKSRAPYFALTIVPREPIGGGSSGTNCLVVCDSLPTISHEVFHWWNGTTIETTPEANWIKEGFTKYYEGKMLNLAGIWSAEDLSEHVEKVHAKLWQNRQPVPINLVQASNNLVRKGANDEYDNVYYGGALVAYYLDRQLSENESSLDGIWGLLNNVEGPITTSGFLQKLRELGGDNLAKQYEDLVYGRRTIDFP